MRVLMIEDDEDDILIVRRLLAGVSATAFEVVGADRLSTAMTLLAADDFDVVLVDLSLPDSQGLETLASVQGQAPLLPTIVLTGWDDTQLGIEAVHAGAQDYLVKGEVLGAFLARCLHYAIERKQNEVRAHQALEAETQANQLLEELNQRKSKFLATISHESRSQLHSIIGYSGVLLQELSGPLTIEQREQVSVIEHAAQYLLDLNSDFLDLSAVEMGLISLTVESFTLGDVVREVVERFEPQIAGHNVVLAVAPSGVAVTLSSDRKRVVQILTNLIDNAVKFTQVGEIRIAWSVRQNCVEVSVADTGVGISQIDLPEIFETFHRADRIAPEGQGGIGLGLYLCRRLVTLLGGDIWVESIPAQGSCFTFSLPLQPVGSLGAAVIH